MDEMTKRAYHGFFGEFDLVYLPELGQQALIYKGDG